MTVKGMAAPDRLTPAFGPWGDVGHHLLHADDTSWPVSRRVDQRSRFGSWRRRQSAILSEHWTRRWRARSQDLWQRHHGDRRPSSSNLIGDNRTQIHSLSSKQVFCLVLEVFCRGIMDNFLHHNKNNNKRLINSTASFRHVARTRHQEWTIDIGGRDRRVAKHHCDVTRLGHGCLCPCPLRLQPLVTPSQVTGDGSH